MTAGLYRPYGRRIGRPRLAHPRRRLALIWMAALIGAVALIARLVGLQLSPSTQLLEEGAKQRVKTIPLQATRGAIVDRNGADLAISVPQTTIAANPQAVVDPAGDAAKLAPILQRDPAELQTLLSSGKEFVYLARQTDDATAAAVKALGLKYVWTYDEAKRFLPSGDSLAVSVVGRTNVDTTGISGLEKQYDDVLRGTSGEEVVEQGRGGRTIPGGKQQIEPAHPGSTLVVSLDRGLQFEAEELLKRAVDDANAKGGTILISKVSTGEILVDANVERTPGSPARATGENRALTWTYEPGSINKAVTMAGVLEEGVAQPDTSRFIGATFETASRKWSQETRPVEAEMTLTDILKNSDNLGTMTWAQDLGQDRLYKYLQAFGLGQPTGLGFPGESAGKVLETGKWTDSSLPTIAIGQGLAVTPMQMLTVYNTIANGGTKVAPRLVLGTETPDGQFTAAPAPAPVRVVSQNTATALTGMLQAAVRDGTGKKAQVAGFTVAGKTGTAWKALDTGGYSDADGRHKLVTSFAGFLPAEHPELAMIVVIDEPADPYATGGTVAAPVFRDVAAYAVRQLRIPPDADVALPNQKDRVRANPQPVANTAASAPPTTAPATTVPPTTTAAKPVTATKTTARTAAATTGTTTNTKTTATKSGTARSSTAAPTTTTAATRSSKGR